MKVALVVLSVTISYLAAELILAPLLHKWFDVFKVAYLVHEDIDHRMQKNDPRRPTNSDGIRCLRESSDFPEHHYNIIFLGDSFIFGYKLPIPQSIPYKIEQNLRARFPSHNVNVANFGWVSSSPLLHYRLLRDIGHKYNPDMVVVSIDMADFHDELVKERMFHSKKVYMQFSRFPMAMSATHRFAPETYKSVLARWTGIDIPRQPFFFSHRPLEETRHLAEPLMRNLGRIHNHVRDSEAKFAVFVLPRHYQYNRREAPLNWEKDKYDLEGKYNLEPFRFFEEQKAKVDYPIYSLLPAFQQTEVFPTCFENDPHWNDAGTTVAADAISQILVALIADS